MVLWSKSSVRSRWVRAEAQEGASRGILVPVLIERVKIPLAFRTIQASDLIGWEGSPTPDFQRLVADISALIGQSRGLLDDLVADRSLKESGADKSGSWLSLRAARQEELQRVEAEATRTAKLEEEERQAEVDGTAEEALRLQRAAEARREATTLMKSARDKLDQGELEAAKGAVQAALELDGSSQAAQQLLALIEEALREELRRVEAEAARKAKLEEEERQAEVDRKAKEALRFQRAAEARREAAALMKSARDRLDRGELQAAKGAVQAALELDGRSQAGQQLLALIEEALREELRRVEAEAAREAKLEEEERQAEVDRRAEEALRHQRATEARREATTLMKSARDRLDRGELQAAKGAVQAALELDGRSQAGQQLLALIEEALRGDPGQTQEIEPRTPPPREPPRPADVPRGGIPPVPRQPQERRAVPRGPKPTLRPPSQIAPPARSRRFWWTAAALAFGAAVLIRGAILLNPSGPEPGQSPTPSDVQSAESDAPPTPEPSRSEPPASTSPAPVPQEGMLLVDALPWGEVTDVVDGSGQHHAIGRSAYTPFTMSVPPGQYKVSVTNPDFAKPALLTTSVPAAGTGKCLAEFQKVSATEYFKRAGW